MVAWTLALALLPQPVSVEGLAGVCRLSPATFLVADAATLPQAEVLAGEMEATLGWRPAIRRTTAPDTAPAIVLRIAPAEARLPREGYRLRVSPGGVVITGADSSGVLYGAMTLLQLLPPPAETRGEAEIPCLRIVDAPRFRWRGLMLDCSRTFQSPEYLRATIDRMARYKLNVLHLHLTDDQGWRLEIGGLPELTGKGARFPERYGEPEAHQGHYTREQMRELVAYAAVRGVTIVPEIEMPGHALAALSCYPEISCTGGPFEIFPYFQGPGVTEDVMCPGSEETFRFIETVLDEVVAVFPSTFLHVGGDEAPRTRWEACPRCQARIRDEGLEDARALQGYFLARVEEMVAARGRRLIGWDEILEGGLPPRAAVMSWRGMEGGIEAAGGGHDVVMSPTSHCYFDYPYDQIDTDRAYSFEPVPEGFTEEQAAHVLGLQANFWSHIDREPALVDRQLYPRLLALAERGWSPAETRDPEDFRRRLAPQVERLEAMGVNLWRAAP